MILNVGFINLIIDTPRLRFLIILLSSTKHRPKQGELGSAYQKTAFMKKGHLVHRKKHTEMFCFPLL